MSPRTPLSRIGLLLIATTTTTTLAQGCVDHPGDDEARAIARSALTVLVAAPTKDAPGACLVVDDVLDIDVPRVQVAGDFLLGGAAPPPYAGQTGHIELRSATLGTVALGQLHTGAFGRWIIPGTYDVVYRHAAGPMVPQNSEVVVAHDVVLDAATTLDIDVPSVLVSGMIAIDGATPPASVYERGHIRLRDAATGATFTVGSSNQGTYAAYVVPGTYDVVWSRALGGTIVPLNRDVVVHAGLVVAGPTTFDVDVPVAHRTGAFRINGASPPQSIYENGDVLLRDVATGDLVTLGQTRHRTYAVRVVPGVYDVVYAHRLGSTHVPRNTSAVVAARVEIAGDGALDIDIPMVTVQGSFVLDGRPFPVSVYNNSRIWLGAEDDVFPIGVTRDQSYSVRVVPGRYDVVYENLTSTGIVPENTAAVIASKHSIGRGALRGSVELDVAVSSGLLGTDVTLDGADAPASIYEHAWISAVNRASGDVVELFRTHVGGDPVRVVAGTYELTYRHAIGHIVPANGDARIGYGTATAAGTPFVVDVATGFMGGAFSQGGQPFLASATHSAVIGLRDRTTGDAIVLGETWSGGYERTLIAGTYDLTYDQVSGGAVPANRGATLGCVTFAP